jgi:hypothetical protein
MIAATDSSILFQAITNAARALANIVIKICQALSSPLYLSIHCGFLLRIRVARWFILVPKITFWVLWRVFELYIKYYILRSFGLIYGHLYNVWPFGVVCGPFGIFSRFLYLDQEKSGNPALKNHSLFPTVGSDCLRCWFHSHFAGTILQHVLNSVQEFMSFNEHIVRANPAIMGCKLK